jgi:hypothetical protein
VKEEEEEEEVLVSPCFTINTQLFCFFPATNIDIIDIGNPGPQSTGIQGGMEPVAGSLRDGLQCSPFLDLVVPRICLCWGVDMVCMCDMLGDSGVSCFAISNNIGVDQKQAEPTKHIEELGR